MHKAKYGESGQKPLICAAHFSKTHQRQHFLAKNSKQSTIQVRIVSKAEQLTCCEYWLGLRLKGFLDPAKGKPSFVDSAESVGKGSKQT